MDVDEDYDTEQSDYGDIPIVGMFLGSNYLTQYIIKYICTQKCVYVYISHTRAHAHAHTHTQHTHTYTYAYR